MLHVELTSSWILLLITGLLLIFLVYWSFKNIKNSFYPKVLKYILACLRIAALIIFILIFSDLKIEKTHDKQVKPDIAILWDLSQSMVLSDSNFTVDRIIGSKAYRNLNKEVNIFHISGMSDPGIISENLLKRSSVNEMISDNGKLIRFAEMQTKFKELVLVGDGHSYLGEELESIRLQKGLKVHAIGVGNKQKSGLPELRSIKYPEHIFEGDSISLTWTLFNSGSELIEAEMFILKDGKEVLRQGVHIPAQRMIIMDKVFPPEAEGNSNWEWYINQGDDNTRFGAENIRIHSSAINILCYAGIPDEDVAMIKTVLSENERYHVFGQEEWFEHYPDHEPDIIIQTWYPDIYPRIHDDIPSVLIYRDDKNTYQSESELEIELMRSYVHFASDPGENTRYWTQLPPIQVARYSDEGKVILRSENDRPVIMEEREKKAIVINASGLWRWNLAGYGKDWNGIYRYLIEGIVEVMIKQFSNAYFSLDEDIYTGIEYYSVPIAVQRTNTDLLDGSETLRLSILDSNYNELKRRELRSDEMLAEFSFEQAGDYILSAQLYYQDILLENDTSYIKIDINDMEKRQNGCNETILKKLAEDNDGHYVSIDSSAKVLSSISTEKQWMQINSMFIARKSYFLFGVMFLLLCADWILRKRFGGM